MSTNQNKYLKHNFYMNLALLQAKKNLGNTHIGISEKTEFNVN